MTNHTTTPLFIPRGLVMLTALWVFVSWIWLFGFSPPLQAQASSYSPSIRLLFASIGVGIGVAWPLLRLSGRASRAPCMQSTYDALAVLVILQVVLWPLRLVTSWTLTRALVLDGALACSIASIASVLALTNGLQRERTRSIVMSALCVVALVPGAWIVCAGGDAPPLATALSAPKLLAFLADATPLDPQEREWNLVGLACASAIFWLAAAGIGSFLAERPRALSEDSTD